MKVRILALLCSLVLLSGCYGLGSDTESSGSPVATMDCIPAVPPPPGFSEISRKKVPQGGIVGLQVMYKGPRGTGLIYTSGVMMDTYVDAPVLKELPLSWGGTASLFKSGEGRWILLWNENNACYQYTIGGDGFNRETFLRLLYDDGVLAQK